MKLAPMLGVMAIVLGGCSASDAPAAEQDSTVDPTSPRTIELAGTEASVHSPPVGTEAAPVVVMLHGTGGDLGFPRVEFFHFGETTLGDFLQAVPERFDHLIG